jgi:hypothetical protein
LYSVTSLCSLLTTRAIASLYICCCLVGLLYRELFRRSRA